MIQSKAPETPNPSPTKSLKVNRSTSTQDKRSVPSKPLLNLDSRRVSAGIVSSSGADSNLCSGNGNPKPIVAVVKPEGQKKCLEVPQIEEKRRLSTGSPEAGLMGKATLSPWGNAVQFGNVGTRRKNSSSSIIPRIGGGGNGPANSSKDKKKVMVMVSSDFVDCRHHNLSKYLWINWTIEKIIFGVLIMYLLYNIRIMQEQMATVLNDTVDRNDKSWRRWLMEQLFEKVSSKELLAFCLVFVLARLSIRGLDLFSRKVEQWHQIQEEELRLKEMKLRSRTEIWKTVTDGLTKVVTTVMRAIVPISMVEDVVTTALDLVKEKSRDKREKKLNKNGTSPSALGSPTSYKISGQGDPQTPILPTVGLGGARVLSSGYGQKKSGSGYGSITNRRSLQNKKSANSTIDAEIGTRTPHPIY